MTSSASPLTTDLYELNMVQAYLDRGEYKAAEAVFEFFVRRLPERRGFLLAAALDDALDYLESRQFSAADIHWLIGTGRFRQNLLDYLSRFQFHRRRACGPGRHRVLSERAADLRDHRAAAGIATPRDAAHQPPPLPDAGRLEGGARGAGAAPDKNLGGFWPAHRAWRAKPGLYSSRRARATCAGFGGAANVRAGARYGKPIVGTMAQSFVQTHDHEITAFENFARARSRMA